MSAVHILPDGWRRISLQQIAAIQTGVAKGKKNIKDPIELPYLRVANVQDGHLNLSEIRSIRISRSEVTRYLLQPGDVLMTEGGDFDKLGRGFVWEGQLSQCLHQNHVFVVRADRSHLDPYFLTYQAGSGLGKGYFLSCSKQSTNLASINSSQLKEFPVVLPPLREQRNIVMSIRTWDRAIVLTERIIAAKQERRAWLMQQLLAGKRRLPGFSGPWRKLSVRDITIESSERNQSRLGTDAVRAVNKVAGMIPMKAHVMADDLDRYKLVKPTWFAYNPMRLNIGSICQWLGEDDALVSPDYVVFSCREEIADHRFFNAFRKSFYWRSRMEAAGNGSVRVRIYYEDLARMPIRLPSLEEQEQIARVVDASDREIGLLQSKKTELHRQKQGLMQQLLTGKRRVKVPQSSGIACKPRKK